MTPHITLLVPFVPARRLDDEVEARLSSVLRRFEAFNYALERLERFADDVLYLAPEPSGPFVELVLALAEAFPDYPPYDGIHETIVPHVTVADNGDAEFLDLLTAELAPALPILCHAKAATMVERGADLRWRPRAVFPLGD